MDLIKELTNLQVGKIKENEKLADYTTYKLAGEIKFVVFPNSIVQLKDLLRFLRENKMKHLVIGKGSNVVFTTEYYDGVVISLQEFDDLKINGDKVTVGSGYNLIKLAYLVSRKGLLGLEFAAGIPGTVGGSLYMNAGAYTSDMAAVVEKATILMPNFALKEFTNEQLDFSYRTSLLQKNKDYICLDVTFKLSKGCPNEAILLIEDRKTRRWDSQPLDFPCAGSVFRNPENDFAGRIIEELGLKGYCIGDAKISEKHANFIINKGNASGKEIKKLIDIIKDKTYEEYQIKLVVEQEFIE